MSEKETLDGLKTRLIKYINSIYKNTNTKMLLEEEKLEIHRNLNKYYIKFKKVFYKYLTMRRNKERIYFRKYVR